uniref:Uncharacterized protein n=1 Tax=Parascaris equorum TaxID=6256 RepID=A0A914RFI9_PAREQ
LNFSDLFRACERFEYVPDFKDNVAILGGLRVLRCASFDFVTLLSQIISDLLSVSREQLEYRLNLRMTSVSAEQEHFTCGLAQGESIETNGCTKVGNIDVVALVRA